MEIIVKSILKMNILTAMIIIILFIFNNFLSCENITMYDIYKNENLPFKGNGQVTNIEFYKGGGITLTILENSGQKKQIAVSREFRDIVKKGDWFEKEENTNKCIIKRNDSIIYLDCFKEIPTELRDSIEIEEWPREIVGKWQLQNKE